MKRDPFPLSHAFIFRKCSTSFYFCFQLILGQLALGCSVFQLYPVQENVWYLYQLRSRSKQQRAEDNTSPGVNNLQGNGPGPAGSCFKILKNGGSSTCQKQEVWVCRVSFSAHSPYPSPPTSWLGVLLQPSRFLCLRTQWWRPQQPDISETTAAFPRFHHTKPSFAAAKPD